jgi:diketogulonate reductase-like aldo/keto reductase
MPVIGMGTWPLKGEACVRAVREALSVGYRHLDTAWRSHLHYDGVLEQHAETLRDLDLSSVDLFLVHWPDDATPMEETFRALSRLYDEGTARSIGVSNFGIAQLEEAVATSSAPICVNQIKYHPKNQQRDVLEWCKKIGVAVTAYSPLAKGQFDPIVEVVAAGIDRSPAQVTLRWLIEEGLIVIPKARSRVHLEENFDLSGWALPDEARDQIRSLGDD